MEHLNKETTQNELFSLWGNDERLGGNKVDYLIILVVILILIIIINKNDYNKK